MQGSVDTVAYVVGTFDTKGAELLYIAHCLRDAGVTVRTVDLSTGGAMSASVDFSAQSVAAFHPQGVDAVLNLSDRGQAVAAMSDAFTRFLSSCTDLSGVIAAGGSGGTALVAPAFRSLSIGVPKMLVSTVASGQVAPYVGGADITMMYSVTDVQGLNRISRKILGNAAHALAGMLQWPVVDESITTRTAVGLTMFGVTTPCVQQISAALEHTFDCFVFHATGTGGQSMEKLVDSGYLGGVIDVTTTEIADRLVGGVFPATDDRLGAIIRTGVPYIGSVGALDMVNFGVRETVPERFRDRLFYQHNPQVTLMRTTSEENHVFGLWLGQRLNRMRGPVRFLLPELGVSMLDAKGQLFYDPEADAALFRALRQSVNQTDDRQLLSIPAHINDERFAQAVVAACRSVLG